MQLVNYDCKYQYLHYSNMVVKRNICSIIVWVSKEMSVVFQYGCQGKYLLQSNILVGRRNICSCLYGCQGKYPQQSCLIVRRNIWGSLVWFQGEIFTVVDIWMSGEMSAEQTSTISTIHEIFLQAHFSFARHNSHNSHLKC